MIYIFFFLFLEEIKGMLIIFLTLNNCSVVPSEVSKEQRKVLSEPSQILVSDFMHFN